MTQGIVSGFTNCSTACSRNLIHIPRAARGGKSVVK
jgi:hypothetical protein